MHLVHLVFLVAVLSLDAFAVSLAYGASKIAIPKRSIMIISLVCSAMLLVALSVGVFLRDYLSRPEIFASLILFSLGFVKVFDGAIKTYIKKKPNFSEKEMMFSLFDINFILTVYAKPETADKDKSRVISPRESIALAVALSLDNLAAGIGAGLVFNPLYAVGVSMVTTPLSILFGLYLGKKLAATGYDFSLASGLVLMVLAFL